MLAGRFAAAERLEQEPSLPPQTTALGALLSYITGDADAETFQPMNVNFGLFPTLGPKITANGKKRKLKGRERKAALASRALRDVDAWLSASKTPAIEAAIE